MGVIVGVIMVRRKTTTINDHFHLYDDGRGGSGGNSAKWHKCIYELADGSHRDAQPTGGMIGGAQVGNHIWQYSCVEQLSSLSGIRYELCDADGTDYVDQVRVFGTHVVGGALVQTVHYTDGVNNASIAMYEVFFTDIDVSADNKLSVLFDVVVATSGQLDIGTVELFGK